MNRATERAPAWQGVVAAVDALLCPLIPPSAKGWFGPLGAHAEVSAARLSAERPLLHATGLSYPC